MSEELRETSGPELGAGGACRTQCRGRGVGMVRAMQRPVHFTLSERRAWGFSAEECALCLPFLKAHSGCC